MPEPQMRQALRADLDTVVDIWVDAFTADPFFRWMQPDDARWPAFGGAWMRFIAEQCFQRGHTYLARSEDVAIAWIPPELDMLDDGDFEHGVAILTELAAEGRVDDAVATIMGAREYTMTAPHWTLQWLGVRTAAQGRGRGAIAVDDILRRCDDEDLPAGLVSSNPRNVPFYERHGFTVVAEIPTPDGQATIRPMHRR
jgi:GNAT superfamily N-acetyltransferase